MLMRVTVTTEHRAIVNREVLRTIVHIGSETARTTDTKEIPSSDIADCHVFYARTGVKRGKGRIE